MMIFWKKVLKKSYVDYIKYNISAIEEEDNIVIKDDSNEWFEEF